MRKIILLIFGFLWIVIGNAQYTVLYNFNYPAYNKNFVMPSLTLVGNKLYGMTTLGGSLGYGSIFSIDTNGNGYKTILNFNDTNGAEPYGSLTLYRGKLFGMTYRGNHNYYRDGNIFSIDTDGNNFKDLYDFEPIIAWGPTGSLFISGNVMYGMTTEGGPTYDYGAVFRIDTDGKDFRVLVNFNGSNGSYPYGDLTLSGNKLFGMTSDYFGNGDIFSIDTNGAEYKDLLEFSGTMGSLPFGDLRLSGNILYGMTSLGGVYDHGCVFAIDTNGSNYKNLLNFNWANGAGPYGSLVLSKGILYGMTYSAGYTYGYGNVFSIDTNGNSYTDMFDFNNTDGANPGGTLTLSGNILFGMTSAGGAYGHGVIFKIDSNSTLAVNEPKSNQCLIIIFPNPSNGLFTLSLSNINARPDEPFGREKCTIEIYNVMGQKVLTQILRSSQNDKVMDLSNQPNGVYFYRVLKEDGSIIGEGKVVIEK